MKKLQMANMSVRRCPAKGNRLYWCVAPSWRRVARLSTDIAFSTFPAQEILAHCH